MKIKYKKMSKEEKKDILNKYKNTSKGKEQLSRLARVNVIGILCILYAIFILITEYQKLNSWLITLIIIMFIVGIIFLILSLKIKKKSLNKYLINKK